MAEAATISGVRYASPSGRWVLFASILGSGMTGVDETVVNLALPTIGREFHTGLSGLQWTSSAYALSLSAFLLIGGSLGDRFGRRRIFMLGAVWFSLASLFCAVAGTLPALIAARAVQGMGGALLTPASLAILEATFTPDDRGRAIGTWSGSLGLATAIAPFLGGFLVDSLSWRWVFLINLPLAALVIWVSAKHLPKMEERQSPTRLDIPGAILAAVGLAALTYALIEGPVLGWKSMLPRLVAIGGAASLVLFVAVEARSRSPMLPLQIFRSRQFSSANVVTLATYAALGASFFLFPIYLQQVLGYSALQAGMTLLPVTAVMLVLSGRMGAWSRQRGPRAPMTLGPTLVAVAFLLIAHLAPGSRFTTGVLPALLILGLGLAVTVAPLTSTVLASAPTNLAGIASAVNVDVANLGGLLAVAVIPSVAGLTAGSFADPTAFSLGFRHSMELCAALAAAGGVLAFLTISNRRVTAPLQRICSLQAPPLQASSLSLPEKKKEDFEEKDQGEGVEALDLLDGGAQAFPRMLAAIREAKRRVHLEVYIFADDRIGRSFVDALSEAARRGVQCTVVIDGWGSALSGRRIARLLREAGCQVSIYNRLISLLLGRLRRNHRKILVVDERIAFVGGLNIGEEYASDASRVGWADLALKLRGPPAAWLAKKLRGERKLPRQQGTRIFLSALAGGGHLRKRYLRAVARAKREVLFAHAYFLPDERLIRALNTAARRGVSVVLLLAGTSDVPFVHAATMRLYRRFLDSGVIIYEWTQSVLHAKVAAVDGESVLLGSFNLDPLSLANLEILVEVQDPAVVQKTEDWIRLRIQRSHRIALADCGLSSVRGWLLDRLGFWAAKMAVHLAGFIARSRPLPFLPSHSQRGRGPG